MNESPSVTYLWLVLRASEVLGPFNHSPCPFQIVVDSLSSKEVSYRHRQADLCHAVAMVREFMATVGPVCRSFLLQYLMVPFATLPSHVRVPRCAVRQRWK